MNIYFTEAAISYLNEIIEEFSIPEEDRYLQLSVKRISFKEVRYVLSDIQDSEWHGIEVGRTHDEITIEGLLSKVLINKNQTLELEELTVDYKKIDGNYAFTFVPKVDKI